MTAKCMSKNAAKWIFWISAVVFVISIALLFVFPSLYQTQLRKQLTLTENSLATEIWEDIPLPIYEKLYFFNITNADDFLKNNDPMNVSEVGPYTYASKWVKKHPQWNSNGTVSFRETRTYHFVPEKSVGDQDDVIFTLNGPMIIAADMIKDYFLPLRIAASIFLKLDGEKLIIQKKIRELAYDGYKDTIIKFAPIVNPNIPYKDGRFSWLYGKNDSNDGLFTSFTGEDDRSKVNVINNWNGQESLSFWKGDTCNKIEGTNLEMGFPPTETPNSYTFFQSILCRSWTLNYTGEQNHYGVSSKRFEPTPMLLANGTENPDNACFDIEGPKPSGVMDISPCQFGAPAFLSFPHFYMADSSYHQCVNGLTANGEQHGSYVDIEKTTGLSIYIRMRFQINLKLSKILGIFQLSNVREGIYPVFWASIDAEITEHWASYLKSSINNPKIIAYSLLGILTFLSIVFMIGSLYIWSPWTRAEDEDPLIDIKKEEKANIRKRTLFVTPPGSVNGDAEDSPTRDV